MKIIISHLIFPIVVGILAFIATNSVTAWRNRKKQSLLGSAVCASFIEELRNGISIMETIQSSINNQAPAIEYLPRKSWSGMNTISDDVLERLLYIAKGKHNRGYPIKEIRIHLKNYFDHMCPNFDTVTSAIATGGQWQQLAHLFIVQSNYIKNAKDVLTMLEEAQKYLDDNAKAIMPK